MHLNRSSTAVLALFLCCVVSTVAQGQAVSNLSQGTNHLTLQAALDNAVDGNIIQILPGTLFEDNLMIPDDVDVTIRGAGAGATIIDGSGGLSTRGVFELVDSGQSNKTVIQDLTIRNDVRGSAAGGVGGAVFLSGDVAVTLLRVELTGNTAPAGIGGARAVHCSTGPRLFCRLAACLITTALRVPPSWSAVPTPTSP